MLLLLTAPDPFEAANSRQAYEMGWSGGPRPTPETARYELADELSRRIDRPVPAPE